MRETRTSHGAPGGLVPPERKFCGYGVLASELIHLPDKPAGVW